MEKLILENQIVIMEALASQGVGHEITKKTERTNTQNLFSNKNNNIINIK